MPRIDSFFRRRDRAPAQHIMDSATAIKSVANGLARKRSLIIIAFVTTPVVFCSLYFYQYLPAISVGYFISLAGIGLFLSILYLRARSIRSIAIKHDLHMLAHTVRDHHIANRKNPKELSIRSLSNELSALIKTYFEHLIPSTQIGIAIRVANRIDGKICYSTQGRAGLNPSRQDTSEPVHLNEGIVKIFTNRQGIGNRGMLIINSIRRASEDGVFTMKRNDELFENEIRSMMVCPINGWDGKDKGMLAILYVTSAQQDVFDEKYVDAMGFLSDMLANIYSEITDSVPHRKTSAPTDTSPTPNNKEFNLGPHSIR